MSKLSFRARALDASKPMPIYMAEELPDLPEYSAINRAVPQMPSGMEKEEECEHHLQRAICAGLIIPTPEVSEANIDAYDKLYPPNYKQPRQLIHMQPFAMEQDIPDYDMDSEDERWLVSQAKKLDLTPLKFEEMMDRLEKSSGQTVVTLNEAKALLKEDDDLIIAVFDYWLNKRLKTQHPLILSVKTEHRTGSAANNPYLAFRRRTEKMQTRKNRKNDETSYEKMLKLRRDLSRAVTLLELVKRREKTKREYLHLTIEVYEKRYQAQDFSGAMLAEVSALKTSRPAFTQIFQNHYSNQSWANKAITKDEIIPRKEKRQYKKRKHKNSSHGRLSAIPGSGIDGIASSDEEEIVPVQPSPEPEDTEEEGQFAFRRNKLCSYHMPIQNGMGNWPWCSPLENGLADRKYRYTLTSLAHPRRCIGFARRRMGRGGRVILDRTSTDFDDLWRQLDFSVIDCAKPTKVKLTNNNSNSNTISDGLTLSKDSTTSDITNTSSILLRNNSMQEKDKVTSCGGISVSNNASWVSNNLASDVIGSGSTTTSINVSASASASASASISDTVTSSCGGISDVVKQEVLDRTAVCDVPVICDQDDILQVLQEIKRDWLHFRPKTPPPSYDDSTTLTSTTTTSTSTTCLDESIFNPSSTTPITVELQNLSSCPSTLMDDSLFTTTPFTLQDLYSDMVNENDSNSNSSTCSSSNMVVPYDDTRQLLSPTSDTSLDRSFGCSRFHVVNASASELYEKPLIQMPNDVHLTTTASISSTSAATTTTPKKHSILSSTLTSPKYNSVNVSSSSSSLSSSMETQNRSKHTILNHVNNGPLPHSELLSSGRKGNKMQHNAYTSGIPGSGSGTRGCSVTSASATSTLNSERERSLRLATHTTVTTHNTLNSHSANILDISSLSNDGNGDAAKLNSQCIDNNVSTTTTTTSSPSNNKQNKQTIVRKNNSLPMEVT